MGKRILIVAGPNGAGKTVFSREVLAVERDVRWANADEIAASICPEDPGSVALEAGHRLLGLIDSFIDHGESFVLETTLAGRSYVPRIHAWRNAGYSVGLVFLSLASPNQAVERVCQRVKQGGHHVADEDVRRRFFSGIANFREHYAPIVDRWQLFDCSTGQRILVEQSR